MSGSWEAGPRSSRGTLVGIRVGAQGGFEFGYVGPGAGAVNPVDRFSVLEQRVGDRAEAFAQAGTLDLPTSGND